MRKLGLKGECTPIFIEIQQCLTTLRQRVASKVDSNFRWQELVDRIQGLFYVFAIRAYNFKWLAKHNSRKKKSTETKPVIDKQVH